MKFEEGFRFRYYKDNALYEVLDSCINVRTGEEIYLCSSVTEARDFSNFIGPTTFNVFTHSDIRKSIDYEEWNDDEIKKYKYKGNAYV